MKKCLIIVILLLNNTFFAQESTKLNIQDTRSSNDAPNFFQHGIRADFKLNSVIGITNPYSGTYSTNLTFAQWDNWNNSGGAHHQLNLNDAGMYYRNGLPMSPTWNNWKKVLLAEEGGSLDFFRRSNNSKIVGHGDPDNYFIGHYDVIGSAGLNLHWYGGIKLGTSAGDVMHINQSGNVGIGTANPSNDQGWQKVLDVSGIDHSKILSTTSNGGVKTGVLSHIIWHGGGGFVGTESNHNLHFITGYSPKVSILTSGKVGIGTLTPEEKLDVNFGGEPKTIKFLEFPNTANSMNSAMRFTWYNDTADFGMVRSGSYPIEGLAIRFNGNEKVRFSTSGNVAVQGKMEAKEIKVTTIPTADFVFEEDYDLPKLEEVEKHIKEKKHLPEIASAKEMEKEGVNLGEFQIKLLQKIEELTLYIINQQKEIDILKKQIKKQD